MLDETHWCLGVRQSFFSKRFVDYDLLEWVCGLYDVDDEVCH